jgi:flagellar protein FlaJ
MLMYCDIKVERDRFIGFVLLFGLGIAAVFTVYLNLLFVMDILLVLMIFGGIYVLFELAVYAWLVMKAASKARVVEEVLPDALMMMSMNIKAGLTTDRALLEAARKEFGPLETEIRRAGKQILAGKDIRHALLEMPKRIKSKVLERTIQLIVEGIESGGELADLLQQTAEDIQTTRMAQAEVRANVMMYAIFIFFAAGIGAPLLFGISTYIVQVLANQYSHFDISQTAMTAGGLQGLKVMQARVVVSESFIFLFAIASLAVTSIFGSMIIGLVKDGEEKGGLKFIPILLGVSLVVFFLVRMLVGGMLSGLI